MDLTPEEKKLVAAHRKQQSINEYAVRTADEYTTEEKCEQFDRLHQYAMNDYDAHKERTLREDTDHYMWEEVIGLLAHDQQHTKFWEHWRDIG